MSIIIHNITEDYKPTGMNQYELLINRKRICFFDHDRSYDGLSQCLRDAADAVDALEDKREEETISNTDFETLSSWINKIRSPDFGK